MNTVATPKCGKLARHKENYNHPNIKYLHTMYHIKLEQVSCNYGQTKERKDSFLRLGSTKSIHTYQYTNDTVLQQNHFAVYRR